MMKIIIIFGAYVELGKGCHHHDNREPDRAWKIYPARRKNDDDDHQEDICFVEHRRRHHHDIWETDRVLENILLKERK